VLTQDPPPASPPSAGNGGVPTPRVDYDQIAHLYDDPARDHIVDGPLVEYLETHPAAMAAGPRVLDVGCGTGKQLLAMQRAFPNARLAGLDRFRGMLAIARRRVPAATLVHGDGAALPFGDARFDYLCNQFAYHHLPDKPQLVAEIARVLKPGGRFSLFNIDPHNMPGWIYYRFFPACWEADQSDFLTAETLAALLEAAGFVNIRLVREHLTSQENLRRFRDKASQRHHTSQLLAIAGDAYAAGIQALDAAVRSAPADATVPSEVALIRIVAERPT